MANSATFIQAEKPNETRRSSGISQPYDPTKLLEDTLTPLRPPPWGTYAFGADKNSPALGHLAEQVDEAEEIRRRIESGR